MRVKSVSSVHALVFCLGLTCTDGYGINNPMDNHQVNPGNNFANMPVESVDIHKRSPESPSGSFEQNPNIDYDSLSKDELLRMFLRLEEQNRQQTQVLQEQLTTVIAQNEECKRRIESLEAVLSKQRKQNTMMVNLANQQTRVVTVQEREKKVERDRIDRQISELLEERSIRSRFLGTQGPTKPCTYTFGLCRVVNLGRGTLQEKRESSVRISQIDAELAVLRTKLANLK